MTGPARSFLREALRRREKEIVENALRSTGGSATLAAVAIGIQRSNLYRLMKRHGLHAQDFRRPL